MSDPSPPRPPFADASEVWTPGSGRRSAPDDVWVQVRADYLAGLSAPACCRRHGVGLTALRRRAADEGWRRADQPWTPPGRLDIDDEGVELETQVQGDLDQVDICELAYVAHRRMMRAVLRGDAAEALRWRRVRLIMDAEQKDVDRWLEQDEHDAVRRRAEATAAAASHASDGVFDDPPDIEPAAPVV